MELRGVEGLLRGVEGLLRGVGVEQVRGVNLTPSVLLGVRGEGVEFIRVT